MRGPPGDRADRRLAGAQALTRDGVPQLGPRFIQPADRIMLGHRAHAGTGELRKDEPHPVAALLTGPEMGQHLIVADTLRLDKACQVDGIIHIGRTLRCRLRSAAYRKQ